MFNRKLEMKAKKMKAKKMKAKKMKVKKMKAKCMRRGHDGLQLKATNGHFYY